METVMLSIEQVAGKYRSLRFNCIAETLGELVSQAEANEMTHLEFAEMLADHELAMREKKRVGLNLKRASFPVLKQLEEFDYRWQTTITNRQLNRLLDFSFIDNRENIVFIGPPGVGKTHLASGIGLKAINAGYKVFFTTAISLVETLEIAELKGELKKKMNSLLKFDMLILDELGYLPLNKQGMYNLFQLINAIYEYRSVIITTNKDFTKWGEFFFEDNVAVPIVDRIIHHSHIFMLGGESYRLKDNLQ
jgi:DNA replication protein DnaC